MRLAGAVHVEEVDLLATQVDEQLGAVGREGQVGGRERPVALPIVRLLLRQVT